MIYELWVGNRLVSCTSNYNWLINEALPFHRQWIYKQPVLITCYKPE